MRLWAVALCAAAALASPAFAQTPVLASKPPLLEVPYLPQTEALCGGAAAAMVMRYWGARDVYPDIFTPLVDRSAGGIHTSALVGELARRRWTAVAGAGDTTRLSAELARGRPVIVLLEDRPGRFHYVVVVSAGADEVVLHDPARAPSRVWNLEKFDAAWQKAERWMLVLTPGPDLRFTSDTEAMPSSAEAKVEPAAAVPCAGEVAAAVSLAERGDKPGARRALEAAAATCPAASGPWRELAGLDALDGDWPAAAEHARRAVANDPADEHAWRVLATAEYLRHDDLAALAAWNRIGEPRTDLVEIKGLEHTRYMVIADAIGVRPKAVLTPDALRLAQRRVLAVPAIAAARVSFRPGESGRAQVEAAVVERTRVPTTYTSWLGIGLRAGTDREIAASVTNVTGGGDVVAASWRWWVHRPMAAVSYAAPGPGGVWRIDASRETQTFGAAAVEETRTRAGAEISNWIDQRTRVRVGTSIESWSGLPRTAALSGRIEFWPIVDRFALEAGAATWRGRGVSFGGADVAGRWRSKGAYIGNVWRADAGYRAVTAASPSSIWPGADTGPARDVLLRAHPLLDDGIIRGGVFGRRLAFGTVEVQRWSKPGKRLVRVAPALFADVARATRGLSSSTELTQVDIGAGLRLSLFGMGQLRVDFAHGLRDGHNALSVGWQQ